MSFSLPEERHRIILNRLASRGRVLAVDLAQEFRTSEDTIRRDLRELASAGLCRRVYGGALPLSPASGTLTEREAHAPERKGALGQAAATLVQRGDIVFLDAGSTNLALARALPLGLGLTVVTNAPALAMAVVGRQGVDVILVGGSLDARSGAALGGRALREVREIRPTLAFIGACALDAEAGVAAFHPEEAEFKRAMADVASAVAVAATSDKLGTTAPYLVFQAAMLDYVVVESDAPDLALDPLRALGVAIHRAHPTPASETV